MMNVFMACKREILPRLDQCLRVNVEGRTLELGLDPDRVFGLARER